MYKRSKLKCLNILTKKKTILNEQYFISKCIYIFSTHVSLVSMNQHFMTKCFECICTSMMDSQVGMYKHLQKHDLT